MTIGSKEHYDIIKQFEKNNIGERLDKEEKHLWRKGIVYQDGIVNRLYNAYISGYAHGRSNYLNQ